MEDPNISELLLEITEVERLLDASNQSDRASHEALSKITHGFREIAADPDRYNAEDDDFRRWAAQFETVLTSIQKSRVNPDVAVAELATRLDNVEVSDSQREAFPDSGNRLGGTL